MIGTRAVEAIEASDTDELLRVVDGLCVARSWNDLLELRDRCREAVSRGKQVWGIEEHIRYRLALEGPAEIAGPIVGEGGARFALGPLPEVAASTKTWIELEPVLSPGPERLSVAAERVARGEHVDLAGLELPGRLLDWEPAYRLASYKKDRVEAHPPPGPRNLELSALPAGFERLDDVDSEAALAELVAPWTDQSNGRCQVVSVAGSHLEAIRALGPTSASVAAIEPAEGLAWMAWAAASGGAHGRRRGAAAGRAIAWWALATVADLDWPAQPDALGEAAARLRWHWFDDGAGETGWALRLALADPGEGLAWAVSAVDQV